MSCFNRLVGVLAVLLLATAGTRAGTVDPFSAEQQSLDALQQAAAMTTIELGEVYGTAPSTLSYSGSFSATSWSASMTGTVAGQAVDFTFSGTTTGPDGSNLSSGSYTDSGTVGGVAGDAWSGGGTWSSGPDPMNSTVLDTVWNSSDTTTYAKPGSKPPEHDTEVVKEGHGPDGTDFIQYYKTVDHMREGDLKTEESNDDEDLGNRSGLRSSTMNFINDGVHLNGLSNFDTGLTSGTITSPLPPTAVATATLLAVVGIALGRRTLIQK
jgi:hypothetical protein